MIENLNVETIKNFIESENFLNNLNPYIRDFSENNIKGDFKQYKNNSLEDILESKPKDEIIKIFSAAVSLAYDDAKRRFSGIGKIWITPNCRDNFFIHIATMIEKIFREPQNNFNDWHKTTCVNLNEYLRELGYNDTTYGKAQKIINMTFKYLYCLDTTNYCEKTFKKCHIPLDSFTLEWCRRYLKDKPKALNSDTSWSGMEYELYNSLQTKIKEQLDYPLYVEFIIWPEIQKHIAAEEFIFSFKSYTTKEKKAFKNKKLSEKFHEISNILEAEKSINRS